MSKFKLSIMVLIFMLCTLFAYTQTYASDSKFITPSLEITDKGINFNKNNEVKDFANATDEVKAINTILEEYRLFILYGSAVVSLTMIGIFIYNFIKLGNTRGNPQARSQCITALIFTGVATALAGSVMTFVQFAYGFLA